MWVNPGQLPRFLATGNHIASQPDATVGSIEATSGRCSHRDLVTASRLVCVDVRQRHLQEILGNRIPVGYHGCAAERFENDRQRGDRVSRRAVLSEVRQVERRLSLASTHVAPIR